MDIIVFFEDGLYGFFFICDEMYFYLDDILDLFSFVKSWNLCIVLNCFMNIEVLYIFSCMVCNFLIVVVVNMGDVKYCSKILDFNCFEDGRY